MGGKRHQIKEKWLEFYHRTTVELLRRRSEYTGGKEGGLGG